MYGLATKQCPHYTDFPPIVNLTLVLTICVAGRRQDMAQSNSILTQFLWTGSGDIRVILSGSSFMPSNLSMMVWPALSLLAGIFMIRIFRIRVWLVLSSCERRLPDYAALVTVR